ncbi:MAG: hypothetical protein QME06_01195 [Desulfobacterales bacterium]|nr:hypothetical protein [Desulfobacterales bacterium]
MPDQVRHDDFETFYELVKFDAFVKSRKHTFFVIPAKAGIQYFKVVATTIGSGFQQNDDFLQVHQILL